MGRSDWRKQKKKNRKSKLGLFPLLMSVILAVAVSFVVLFFTDSFGFASSLRELLTASRVETVDDDGVQVIDGDYTVDAPGERLENVHITGSLFLAPGIGDGSVDLANVTVDGAVLVQGGGLNTVFMLNCTFAEVKVNRPEGRVRLVASGETSIESVVLETGARVVENLADGFDGIQIIEVITDEKVELSGGFDTIEVSVKDANIEIDSDRLRKLLVTANASGTAIKHADDMIIDRLYLDGTTYLIGRSRVDQAILSATGVTELAGSFNEVRITAEAGRFELMEESIFSKLIVAQGALNNILNLQDDVLVGYLELNEAVEVTGAGEIEKAFINAAGSNIEQIPKDIEFGRAASVIIAGYEITSPEMLYVLIEHGDPHYTTPEPAAQEAAEPAPQPEADPGPEPEPEPEADPEPEPEPEPEQESDPENGLIKDFIVEEGISVGKKLVIVALNVDDPQNYSVKVGDTPLGFQSDYGMFWGEVFEDEARLENVVISQ